MYIRVYNLLEYIPVCTILVTFFNIYDKQELTTLSSANTFNLDMAKILMHNRYHFSL